MIKNRRKKCIMLQINHVEINLNKKKKKENMQNQTKLSL